jgi:DNA-directed RNA polymerase subunit RPC12/RpoP
MVNCPKCHTKRPIFKESNSLRQFFLGEWTCPRCGCEIDKNGELIKQKEKPLTKCPFCGSKNLQAVAIHKTKGFDTGTGCCGAILFGPFGWFCGMSEMGKGKTEAKRMCMKCGKTF